MSTERRKSSRRRCSWLWRGWRTLSSVLRFLRAVGSCYGIERARSRFLRGIDPGMVSWSAVPRDLPHRTIYDGTRLRCFPWLAGIRGKVAACAVGDTVSSGGELLPVGDETFERLAKGEGHGVFECRYRRCHRGGVAGTRPTAASGGDLAASRADRTDGRDLLPWRCGARPHDGTGLSDLRSAAVLLGSFRYGSPALRRYGFVP